MTDASGALQPGCLPNAADLRPGDVIVNRHTPKCLAADNAVTSEYLRDYTLRAALESRGSGRGRPNERVVARRLRDLFLDGN
jgi:hypothetical protein